jgi:predicted flap endonuclease-1-like 5' DNA nuclease
MSTILILLTQTKNATTIEILLLMLIATIFGFIAAWYYFKSMYLKKSEVYKVEKRLMNKQAVCLSADKIDLTDRLIEKDRETEHLILEVKALKALHAEAVQETNDMTLKNTRNEQRLYEKDEALVHITKRKHLLNYDSFGRSPEAEKDDLKMISGIGPFIMERLHALDIYTFRQISKFTSRDIETINDALEYFSGRIERDEWVFQAKELVDIKDKRSDMLARIRKGKAKIHYSRIGIAKKEEANDLTIISGIGGWIMEKLNALDIYTFQQISNFTNEDIQLVTDVIEYFPGRIERDEWLVQARELVRIAGKKSELLVRIRERKDILYYDRLGVSLKHLANNLTLIKGISLWMEERLNLLDICTFKQISKFTDSDIESISEILEIPSGRINKEKWVAQAYAHVMLQIAVDQAS